MTTFIIVCLILAIIILFCSLHDVKQQLETQQEFNAQMIKFTKDANELSQANQERFSLIHKRMDLRTGG